MTTDPTPLWESDHPYYASDGCYYVGGDRWGDVHQELDSWAEFMSYSLGKSDPDLNLLYRWDWQVPDPADYLDGEEVPGERLELFFMLQRKARPLSCRIKITREDEPAIRAWLTERAKTIRAVWAPLLDGPAS